MPNEEHRRGVADAGGDGDAVADTGGEGGEGTPVWEDDDGGWSLDADGEGPAVGIDTEEVIDESGSSELWFKGETSAYRPGEQFLWAMSGAGLYTLSFAAVVGGFTLVGAPGARGQFVELLRNAVGLFLFPLSAYLGVGVAFELFGWIRRNVEGAVVTPSLFAASLVVPVLVHLAQFSFEVAGPGYSATALSALVVQYPLLSQLYVWPPVLVGSGFVLVVYQTLIDLPEP